MRYIHHIFSVSLFWLLFASIIVAQQLPMKPLPIDSGIHYGKLVNGLTYYIRHNALPKERADFFLVQNVGSILEEENQRGLAHVLEHMAFDGSKHFPGHAMDEYTESIGMRGGENFNAYTGFDETIYMIMNAPVKRRSVVDSCLLILHDWSNCITLADTSIEKERAVIREEWRTRQDAQARLWEQQLPKMFPGSRYASRMPIGSIDVINHFKSEELRAYYKKWYRPDLQGVIIVGDINADSVERALKQVFADIPTPVNPANRPYFEVTNNDSPLVSVATDKESSNTILSLFYKHERMPKELTATMAGLLKDYMDEVAVSMINDRFSEILQKADPPFVVAQAADGNYMVAKTKDAWTVSALVKENDINRAMIALVNETERVKRYGFTPSEYDRARINVLKDYESIYNDRDKQKNRTFTNEYASHFTDGGYIPGIETEYILINQLAPRISVEQINEHVKSLIGDRNIVISLTGPQKEGLKYPSEAQLLESFKKAQQMPVEPYRETVSDKPLVSNLPIPGKIKSCRIDPQFGATVMTLSNGVKVVLKHTDFKKDEILMTATSPGGSTLYGSKEIANLKILNDVIGLGGLGDFSLIDLGKVLAGKKVSCSSSIGLDDESLNGYAAPSDIKTLFELIYLNFTAPRIDEEAYKSFESRIKAQLVNLQLNPMIVLNDTLASILYNGNPRAARIVVSDFDNITYSRVMQICKERFADASGFVFTFTGNLNPDTLKPLIKQYLAALPTKGVIEKGNPLEVPAFRKGHYSDIIKRKMETPKATVVDFWSGRMPYNLENILTSNMLKQILDLIYTKQIRENEGGTYDIATTVQIASFPEGQTYLQTSFETDPAKQKELNAIVHHEMENLLENGPTAEDFKKSRDNVMKRHAEKMQENGYWLNILDNYYSRHFDGYTDFVKTMNSITPAKIQSFARMLVGQGNNIQVVMEP